MTPRATGATRAGGATRTIGVTAALAITGCTLVSGWSDLQRGAPPSTPTSGDAATDADASGSSSSGDGGSSGNPPRLKCGSETCRSDEICCDFPGYGRGCDFADDCQMQGGFTLACAPDTCGTGACCLDVSGSFIAACANACLPGTLRLCDRRDPSSCPSGQTCSALGSTTVDVCR